ncbi:MAG: thiamine pyrophosphate-requiring protein [Chloroflexota bacterium]|nr:thiamine pyrophosphate-requiring protein [Chloroflexota bacterium]
MHVAAAIAQILKREGVDCLIGYPVNPVIEAAAEADIRTIIVRQERTGLHMADAISRMSSGQRVGVFAMQHGPGTENAFGGVAQAYSEGVPMVVIPGAYVRSQMQVKPNFHAYLNYQHVTKSIETLVLGSATADTFRRAFAQARSTRMGPALVELPYDLAREEFSGELTYDPPQRLRSAPDPREVESAARALAAAQRPVIYAGQGVHYARAWPKLRQLAELLEAPVATTLPGKSAFPETHPLSLGSGGAAIPETVHHFLGQADVIFAVGASLTRTNFAAKIPPGKTVIQATSDPNDINKDVPAQYGLVGDADLVLGAMIDAVRDVVGSQPRGRQEAVSGEIEQVRQAWLSRWAPKMDSDAVPLNPYRVLRDLAATVDVANTIITHDAGSPRDQLSPFWRSIEPLSYIGWGKTTQLGYGLGLAMGAKLACPDKLCMNVWGDAAIGFTGMDFETAVRERIPILSVLLNNFSMAMELPVMKVATDKYRSTDISGNYADFARALGGYGERVTTPDAIVPAIRRGIEQVQGGTPALLEFVTSHEIQYSRY